jgi:hypothetical protein
MDYVYNQVREGDRKVTLSNQTEITFEKDLFFGKLMFLNQNNGIEPPCF